MKQDWLEQYLLAFPGAEHDYKVEWGWDRYMVRGKLFAATMGAPSLWCRIAQISAKQEITRIVSDTLSPFDAEEEPASEKPMTLPPKFSMAASKLSLVLVLGS